MVARWDRSQERYALDREARFDVVADVVATVADEGGSPATVLDVGCGPGSLAARLADRVPDIEVIGIDADPVLLALGRAAAGDRVRFVEAHVGRPGWQRKLAVAGEVDATVSSAVFHYPPPRSCPRSTRTCAPCFARAASWSTPTTSRIRNPCSRRCGERSAQRPTRPPTRLTGPDGGRRWRATRSCERSRPKGRWRLGSTATTGLSAAEHEQLLRAAGFDEVGMVWRHGPSAVLVAIR